MLWLTGDYNYRSSDGSELHMNDPAAIAALQAATAENSTETFKKFSELNTKVSSGGLAFILEWILARTWRLPA